MLAVCLSVGLMPVDVFAGQWVESDGNWYYYDNDGQKLTSTWIKRGNDYYFVREDGTMAYSTFMKYDGSTYYLLPDGRMATGEQNIGGKNYTFNVDGELVSNEEKGAIEFSMKVAALKEELNSQESDDSQKYKGRVSAKSVIKSYPEGKTSLKRMLQIAMKPVGSTLYVWGGGWNADDATRYGLNPRWLNFFNSQSGSYDFEDYLYAYGNGLDCSGYVGWTIYNNLYHSSGKHNFTVLSTDAAAACASKGWGSYASNGTFRDFRAGDIMSSTCGDCRHVWIALGQCSDGSVVFLHSTPPGGVQISGTATPSGNQNSEAFVLADYYMKTYYPVWYSKFGVQCKNTSYLTHYSRMRWDTTGTRIMSDMEGYAGKDAVSILKDLFFGVSIP